MEALNNNTDSDAGKDKGHSNVSMAESRKGTFERMDKSIASLIALDPKISLLQLPAYDPEDYSGLGPYVSGKKTMRVSGTKSTHLFGVQVAARANLLHQEFNPEAADFEYGRKVGLEGFAVRNVGGGLFLFAKAVAGHWKFWDSYQRVCVENNIPLSSVRCPTFAKQQALAQKAIRLNVFEAVEGESYSARLIDFGQYRHHGCEVSHIGLEIINRNGQESYHACDNQNGAFSFGGGHGLSMMRTHGVESMTTDVNGETVRVHSQYIELHDANGVVVYRDLRMPRNMVAHLTSHLGRTVVGIGTNAIYSNVGNQSWSYLDGGTNLDIRLVNDSIRSTELGPVTTPAAMAALNQFKETVIQTVDQTGVSFEIVQTTERAFTLKTHPLTAKAKRDRGRQFKFYHCKAKVGGKACMSAAKSKTDMMCKKHHKQFGDRGLPTFNQGSPRPKTQEQRASSAKENNKPNTKRSKRS